MKVFGCGYSGLFFISVGLVLAQIVSIVGHIVPDCGPCDTAQGSPCKLGSEELETHVPMVRSSASSQKGMICCHMVDLNHTIHVGPLAKNSIAL